MSKARIGVIGVGPRGLTVLERIVAHERQQGSGDLEVVLFDPQAPGAGCHDPKQSDIHLVNTVAGQLTQFSDASVVDAGPVMNGPSFYQWVQDQTRMGTLTLPAGMPLSPDAYYPRALFGRYLLWAYRYICALAPSHLRITFRQQIVKRAYRDGNDAWVLEVEGARIRVDYLYLTTGHTKPRPLAAPPAGPAQPTRVVDDPYPMRQRLQAAAPHMTVAVEGMGLTAFDVLAELTTGRGGRFEGDLCAGPLRYRRSGQEPRIVLFSRSGLPLGARARNEKGISGQYKARFLKADVIRALRATQKLDFVAQVLPLLVADMEHAYYDAYFRQRGGAASAEAFCRRLVDAQGAGARAALVAQQVPLADRLSWDRLASPIPAAALDSRAQFRHWLVEHLRQDVQEARKGNLGSPLKAACDVMRDLRDNLRAAIEFGGLTEASHRWVLEQFMPVMNRLAVGPPMSRICELLALIEAGVVEADHGPAAVCEQRCGLSRVGSPRWAAGSDEVHLLVKARISMHSPGEDASSLLQGLLDDGHVRLFRNGHYHPGGIEVDRHHNWVAESGRAIENAWALGIPTEGVKFCTFVIPRTGVNSTALVDGGRAVGRMLAHARSRQGAAVGAPASLLPSEDQASAYASLHGVL